MLYFNKMMVMSALFGFSVINLSFYSLMRTSGEAANTDFIVFDLTRPHIDPILVYFIVLYIVQVVKNI